MNLSLSVCLVTLITYRAHSISCVESQKRQFYYVLLMLSRVVTNLNVHTLLILKTGGWGKIANKKMGEILKSWNASSPFSIYPFLPHLLEELLQACRCHRVALSCSGSQKKKKTKEEGESVVV